MADEESTPLEEEVRDRQESAIDTLHGLGGQLAALEEELSKRPTDEQLMQRLKDNSAALEYNRKRGLAGLWIGGLIITLVLMLVGVPLLINSFVNRANANQIRNCTTPGPIKDAKDPLHTGHDCFDDGQRRTANILTKAASNEVIILNCYRDENRVLRSEKDFVSCVKTRLGGDG